MGPTVTMRRSGWVLAMFALTAAACTDHFSTGSVSLEVVQQQTGPVYTEGSVSYVRVDMPAESGSKARRIFEQSRGPGPSPTTLAELSIPAGRVMVTTWQRPCIANCDNLDAAAARCEVSFVAAKHARVIVHTTFNASTGCTADVEGADAR